MIHTPDWMPTEKLRRQAYARTKSRLLRLVAGQERMYIGNTSSQHIPVTEEDIAEERGCLLRIAETLDADTMDDAVSLLYRLGIEAQQEGER